VTTVACQYGIGVLIFGYLGMPLNAQQEFAAWQILAGLGLISNFGAMVLTRQLVKRMGTEAEVNPFMRRIMKHNKSLGMLMGPMAISCAYILLLYVIGNLNTTVGMGSTFGMTTASVFDLVHDLIV
jgi:hypothetical protein